MRGVFSGLHRLFVWADRRPTATDRPLPRRAGPGAQFSHPHPGSAGADCAECGDYEGTKREIKHGRSGGTARVFVLRECLFHPFRCVHNNIAGGSGTRPYGGYKTAAFFSQGPVLDRPTGGAHPRVASLAPAGQFTFSPSPTVLKKLFRDWAGEALGPPAGICTGSVGSVKPGAEMEPHSLSFSTNPGPSGPAGI